MAKDNREIKTVIRVPAQRGANGRAVGAAVTYGKGQEDELAAALTPERGEQLVESGDLTGDWTFTGGEKPKAVSGAAQKPA